jgi:hypothetical protein
MEKIEAKAEAFRTNFKMWLHPIQSNPIQNFKQQKIFLATMFVGVRRN